MTTNLNTKIKSIQAPSAVVMIRPHHFHPNPETAADNAFQSTDSTASAQAIADVARDEVTAAAAALEAAGVRVHIFDDFGEQQTPDSVFPNNWFSTHAGGHVAIYPMYSPNRRRERRIDVIDMLKAQYRVQDVIDYSGLEYDELFLEGTGAMVLDHLDRVAYTARSNRANAVALERFCTHFNFEPMAFDSADSTGCAIYHTNVLMCIGTEFALIGLDMITDPVRRSEIRARLQATGREVIDAERTADQRVRRQCDRAVDRQRPGAGDVGPCGSEPAPGTGQIIERSARILPLSVPTIEMAGGSVRCMLAGIHLTRR